MATKEVDVSVQEKTVNVSLGQIIQGSATVRNSDSSYSVTVNSGSTLVLPDITVTDYDASTFTSPSVKDVSATQISSSYNWPPPPAQTGASPIDGSHIWIEDNIFNTVRDDNNAITPNLATRTTLVDNNSFANKNRFTNSVGGTVYDGSDSSIANYKIDHYTGLGFYLVPNATNRNYDDTVSNHGLGTDFGGSANSGTFTDWWVMPLHIALLYVSDVAASGAVPYADFSNIAANTQQWTSTTDDRLSSKAYTINNGIDTLSVRQNKTVTVSHTLCRKHF